MPGVKRFDRNEALDRAMALFWRHGYQATSIQDSVEATGVNRGSLYATFGDKCGLFLAVLDHYSDRIGRPLLAELENPDPRRAIEAMFESIIRRTSDPTRPRGCLDTNTSLECPGAGDDIGRKIAERIGFQESAIYQVLRRAQSDGVLDREQDTRALARFFVGVAQGLNVVNKAMPDPAILIDMVKVAMRVWDVRSDSAGRNGPRKIKARTTKTRRSKPKRTSSRARLSPS
jgi:TetR/AcrR family transcriptional regulator, transcriptional repressor for nem operon